MSISYSIKKFDELSPVDLYYILQARSQVFVVEQQCAYQDIDEIDFDCLHLVAHKDKSLIGYCRIIPPGVGISAAAPPVSPDTPTPGCRIGRVLVLPEHRGDGLAREIMTRAIKHCRSKYGKRTIGISAQTYLIHFYQSLGFESVGQPYLEDGLEHINMVLKTPKRKGLLPSTKETSVQSILTNAVLFIVAVGIIGMLYLLI